MINKFSPTPLYLQLKDMILKKIESGDYAPHTKVPSEQELCEQYDISRPTVRQAMQELTASGFLYKEKGRGTFVAGSSARLEIRQYSGFSDSVLDCPPDAKNREIISAELQSAAMQPRAAQILGVSPDGMLAVIRSRISSDGEPLAVITSCLSAQHFPQITADVLAGKSSYDILRGKLGLVPSRSRCYFEVDICDAEFAHRLQTQPGLPLIRVESLLLNRNNQPLEAVTAWYRAERSRFMFENVRA